MCSNADAHLKGDKVMAKKLRCDVYELDWVKVEDNGEHVEIIVHNSGSGVNERIYLTPENAKKLRKQINVALAEIECEPEEDIADEKEEAEYIPHVGEVVEVYRNTVFHQFYIGDRVRIVSVGDGGYIKAEYLNGSGVWWVASDIRPIQNWKPKEGEKVLIVDSTFAPNNTTRSWVGNFGIIGPNAGGVALVYNEDKSDWFGFYASDLRPAE